jgi:hypothetical protein
LTNTTRSPKSGILALAGDEGRIDPRPTAVIDDFAAAVVRITTHQGS